MCRDRKPLIRQEDCRSDRSPRDPLGWMPEPDRSRCDLSQFSDEQLSAIAKDTRLPGEIGSTYGVSAAVILWIQRLLARRRW